MKIGLLIFFLSFSCGETQHENDRSSFPSHSNDDIKKSNSDPSEKKDPSKKETAEESPSKTPDVVDSTPNDAYLYQTMQFDFQGPVADELQQNPNPFLDYRLFVNFKGPDKKEYRVPGFFNGDGEGNGEGNIWTVKFSPDQDGIWTYEVSFETEKNIAVADKNISGEPIKDIDKKTGTFKIGPVPLDAKGHFSKGMLTGVQKHYLQFANGEYWLKGGTDSPENFLAYKGFDNTTTSRFLIHSFQNHIQHWNVGDPDWNNGAGKGIIGAINYLSSKHVNSIYVMPMNIGGDGQDVWPFAGEINPNGGNENLYYDISKLQQWEILFQHAQQKGIVIHMVLNEAEANNKMELDNTELGIERKLFYRELIARFGHHNGLIWNLSEEYNLWIDLGVNKIKSYAAYIRDLDPYKHPITVHNQGGLEQNYSGFIGDHNFDITSFQIGKDSVENIVETWREKSSASGWKLAISIDEFTVDMGQKEDWYPSYSPDDYRKLKTWPIYLSGGQMEFILEELLRVDDFDKYRKLWDETWYARKFLLELPFWDMEPMDHLLDQESSYSNGNRKGNIGGQVFGKIDSVYVVYFPNASSTGFLDLSSTSEDFELKWYNPREGKFEGNTINISGGSNLKVPSPPKDNQSDWVLLITKI